MLNLADLFSQSVASHQAGDFAAAANGYAKVLSNQPRNSDAWHLAGVLAYQNGRAVDAINQIQIAIEINPNQAEYYCNLAVVLLGTGQVDPALVAANQSLAIDPGFHQAHFQRGKALAKTNRLDDAYNAFESAINFGGDEVAIAIEIADVLQIQGKLNEAIERLTSASEKAPENAQIYIELAKFVTSGQFQFNTACYSKMSSLCRDSQTLSMADRARLHNALAIHCQSQKQYETAFDHFTSANRWMIENNKRTKRATFDRYKNETYSERLIEYFDSEFFGHNRDIGNNTTLPIFVIGMPRSGTTLVHQLLSNHSQVFGLGELTAIGDLFTATVLSHGENDQWRQLETDQIVNAGERYLAHVESLMPGSKKTKVTRTIDKMPGNYSNIGFIKTLFPNAKFIHCVRDPRDVGLSCYQTLFNNPHLQAATSSLNNIADLFQTYQKLMRHWETLFADDIFNLDYRMIVNATEHAIGDTLRFLGLPLESNCSHVSPVNNTPIRTASVAQARRPIYKTSLAKWRPYEEQLGVLSERLATAIDDYNGTSPGIAIS